LIGSESKPEAHIGALPEPIVKKIRKKELADLFRVYTRSTHIGALPEPIVKKIRIKELADWFRVCTRRPHWCTA